MCEKFLQEVDSFQRYLSFCSFPSVIMHKQESAINCDLSRREGDIGHP